MKAASGLPSVTDMLSEDLHLEWNAILVYRAHADAIPEPEIAQGLTRIMVVEERHAAELAQRIEELGGQPESMDQFTTASGRAIATTSRFARTAQMLRLDLDEEERAAESYRRHIAAITDDEETLALLRRHLRDEEAHARWLAERIAALR